MVSQAVNDTRMLFALLLHLCQIIYYHFEQNYQLRLALGKTFPLILKILRNGAKVIV